MKILITGAAGYIGSILTPLLLRKGHRVIALDNFMFGQTSLLDYCFYPNLEIVRGDVRDKYLVFQRLKGVDCIIPLAAIVGAPACNQDPMAAKTINLGAIRSLLKQRSPDQMIIYPNTNSGYGLGPENRIFCTEETPLKPISLYGQTKVQAEEEILSTIQAVSLRLGTVAGVSPRMRLDLLVNEFVYRALTDRFIILFEGSFKRNYVHIRDVAKAFVHTIDHFDQMRGQAYNVGLSEANLSKLELCQEIKKQIPDFYFHEAPIGQDPDKRNYIVSNAKIEKTGFKAVISISKAIAELIKAFQIIRPRPLKNA